MLKVRLPEPFKNTLSFCVMISGGVHINCLQEYETAMFSDEDDKILIFNYGALKGAGAYAPSMFVIDPVVEALKELQYDQHNSELCSQSKRLIVFDEASQFVIAFSQINFHEFDYMALASEPLRWRKSKFVSEHVI